MKIGAWLDAGMAAGDVVHVSTQLDRHPAVGSVWLSEAYIGRDAVALAAAAAQATSSLRVATAIVNPFTRDPAMLAMTALTMNELAPGRFVLGIGTGETHWMNALGHTFPKPLTAMREAGREIRRIVAGEAVESGGHRVQTIIRDPDRSLELYLAAIGPKMCELAGAEYEGCILPAASPQLVRTAIANIRSGEIAAARAAGSCETVATLFFSAGDDLQALKVRLRRKLALLLTAPSSSSMLERGGVDPAHGDRFRADISELGLRNAIPRLADEVVEAFTIYGPLGSCAERLAEFAATGLDIAALLCEAEQVDSLVALTELMEAA